jgi:hypothetical protein
MLLSGMESLPALGWGLKMGIGGAGSDGKNITHPFSALPPFPKRERLLDANIEDSVILILYIYVKNNSRSSNRRDIR